MLNCWVWSISDVCLLAGLQAVLLLRPGNAPLPPDHGFRTIKSLLELWTAMLNSLVVNPWKVVHQFCRLNEFCKWCLRIDWTHAVARWHQSLDAAVSRESSYNIPCSCMKLSLLGTRLNAWNLVLLSWTLEFIYCSCRSFDYPEAGATFWCQLQSWTGWDKP